MTDVTSAESAILVLRVDVPMTGLRPMWAREYQETYPVPPPSTIYGMLLSLIGVEREHKNRHAGLRIAIAMAENTEDSFWQRREKGRIFRKFRRVAQTTDDPSSLLSKEIKKRIFGDRGILKKARKTLPEEIDDTFINSWEKDIDSQIKSFRNNFWKTANDEEAKERFVEFIEKCLRKIADFFSNNFPEFDKNETQNALDEVCQAALSGKIVDPLADRRPDYQELLLGLEFWLWIDDSRASHPLCGEIRKALDPEKRGEIVRHGALCLGESSHMVNEVTKDRPHGRGRFVVPCEQGFLSMPVWSDHKKDRPTVLNFEIREPEELSNTPPDACWITVAPR